MTISVVELAKARGMTAELLEELNLSGYLFELDAFGGDWRLRLDCAVEGGWASLQVPISRERLLSCDRDSNAREQMLQEWRRRLSSCRIGDADA